MKVRDNASQEWIEILAVKGDKGDAGVGISSAEINSSGYLIITYTNGTTQNVGKVQASGGGTEDGTITVSTDYTLEGLQLANGTTYGNTYRLTSDFIAVEEGDEITFSADGSDWQVSGCAYTADKTWVVGFPSDTWEQLGTYTAGGTGYIRVTFRQGGYQGTEFTLADASKCHITIRRAKPSIKVDTALDQNSKNAIANSAVTYAITGMEVNINNIITTLNGFLNPTKYAMPCATGYSNFSAGSVYWKTPDNMVHLTVIININTTTNANANLFNMPVGYRPAATVVIPAITSYETNYMPQAAGINFNSDGTCRYYGPQLGTNNHLMINAEYPAAATSAQVED